MNGLLFTLEWTLQDSPGAGVQCDMITGTIMFVTFVEHGCNMMLASNIIATRILSFLNNMGTELEHAILLFTAHCCCQYSYVAHNYCHYTSHDNVI